MGQQQLPTAVFASSKIRKADIRNATTSKWSHRPFLLPYTTSTTTTSFTKMMSLKKPKHGDKKNEKMEKANRLQKKQIDSKMIKIMMIVYAIMSCVSSLLATLHKPACIVAVLLYSYCVRFCFRFFLACVPKKKQKFISFGVICL
jgi:hypothetical protein